MTPVPPKSAQHDSHNEPVAVATLREVGLFGALTDATIEHLARTLSTTRAATGDVVFREGDVPAREMYVVLEGEMEVSKRSRRGRDIRIAILGPNDWFGEMSMIDLQPRSATVRALAPSRLVRMTSADLDAVYRLDLKSYALIILNVARDLSRRLRVTDGILADFGAQALDQYAVASKR
jgi:CRP-like cAMP-binding protein